VVAFYQVPDRLVCVPFAGKQRVQRFHRLIGAAQLGRRDELAEHLPAEQPVVLQVQVRTLEVVFT
jgi:hypothetical protein